MSVYFSRTLSFPGVQISAVLLCFVYSSMLNLYVVVLIGFRVTTLKRSLSCLRGFSIRRFS